MVEFEFEGLRFEADDDVLTDYDFVCDVLTADTEPAALVRCFKAVFAGRGSPRWESCLPQPSRRQVRTQKTSPARTTVA